jgi:outer membrane protein
MRVFAAIRRALVPAALLALLLDSSAAVAQTPAGPLSLADAISMARENNPDYLAQRNQLRSAEWGVRSAYGSLFPTANISNSFGYTGTGERRFDTVQLGEQPAMYSSRYQLGFSLSLNGSTLLQPSVARAQARAVDQQVDGATASLDGEVTQRYLGVLQSRDAVAQAERELARTDEHVRLAEARFEVGAGTQLDVRRAEVQRGQAEVRLVQSRNTAASEVLLLGQLTGVRLPIDIELSDEFALFEPRWSADELIATALTGSPALRASRAQADAAATRARAASTAYLPTVSFSAGFSGSVFQAGDTSPLVTQQLASAGRSFTQCLEQNQIRQAAGLAPLTCLDPSNPAVEAAIRQQIDAQNQGFPFGWDRQPASASISVSVPILTGLNRPQQVEEARIQRLNSDHQVRAQELRVEVEVETALRNLETAYRTALLQRQVRDTAEEELRLAEERFRFGAATSVEVVDAQASLAEAERAEIAAIYDFHRSLAVLETRLGHPLAR